MNTDWPFEVVGSEETESSSHALAVESLRCIGSIHTEIVDSASWYEFLTPERIPADPSRTQLAEMSRRTNGARVHEGPYPS